MEIHRRTHFRCRKCLYTDGKIWPSIYTITPIENLTQSYQDLYLRKTTIGKYVIRQQYLDSNENLALLIFSIVTVEN